MKRGGGEEEEKSEKKEEVEEEFLSLKEYISHSSSQFHFRNEGTSAQKS